MAILDYSDGFPMQITGHGGTVRYIGTPGHPKNLTSYEMAVQQPQPVARAYVVEFGAGWMLGGRKAGLEAGDAARSDAYDLQIPISRLYAACDINTSPGDYPAIRDCLLGMQPAFGASIVSLYGEANVIDAMWAQGAITMPAWQTVAWSGGRVSEHACLLQTGGQAVIGGVTCDLNEVLDPGGNWGQWPPPAPPNVPVKAGWPLADRWASDD